MLYLVAKITDIIEIIDLSELMTGCIFNPFTCQQALVVIRCIQELLYTAPVNQVMIRCIQVTGNYPVESIELTFMPVVVTTFITELLTRGIDTISGHSIKYFNVL